MSPSERIGNHFSAPEGRFRMRDLMVPKKKKEPIEVEVDMEGLAAPPATLEPKYNTKKPNSHSIMELTVS